MAIQDWLKATTTILQDADISTARLDALVLLEDCLNKDRAHLLAHPELELTAEQVKKLDVHISRRAAHEPLAYIRGKTEFYGREFYIDHHVLEPRPESETMIDLLKGLVDGRQQTVDSIVDVGTGSGALAITAKLEMPQAEVTAIDIDSACLKVARQNAKKHKADINFLEGDLVSPLLSTDYRLQSTILLCNLPYVPDDFQINRAAMQEPRLAIFGGPDGLNLYRTLFAYINNSAQKPLYVLTESMPPQHEQLATIAERCGFRLTQTEDFIQVFRGEE